MVDTFFRLMSTPADTPEEDEDYVSAQESNNPGTIASQTMDILALCLPPDKLIPLLVRTLLLIINLFLTFCLAFSYYFIQSCFEFIFEILAMSIFK
jgi:hypothetical protein